ncbi:MAG: hypothetical protein ACLUE2_18290 [Bacteroides cellulosilyticus]
MPSATGVTPYVECGLKLKGVNEIYNLLESLLMWECGLKHDELAQTNSQTPSLLMWECGLKQPWDIILEYHLNVTPYVGVWIENSNRRNKNNARRGHSLMWECGLKPQCATHGRASR